MNIDNIEDILPKDRETELVFFVNGKKVSFNYCKSLLLLLNLFNSSVHHKYVNYVCLYYTKRYLLELSIQCTMQINLK